jgi:hypothetical protein
MNEETRQFKFEYLRLFSFQVIGQLYYNLIFTN